MVADQATGSERCQKRSLRPHTDEGDRQEVNGALESTCCKPSGDTGVRALGYTAKKRQKRMGELRKNEDGGRMQGMRCAELFDLLATNPTCTWSVTRSRTLAMPASADFQGPTMPTHVVTAAYRELIGHSTVWL
ncbi:hypothetical protein TgHK011_002659 [Trichoderma gracile]|nr:hypothetical protein TgHK011_002659 [Trichoderma gracile]